MENRARPPPRRPARTASARTSIDYATGRELPADKLSTPEVKKFRGRSPSAGPSRSASSSMGGEWNIAPLAIPNLMSTLHDKLKFDVVIGQKELRTERPEHRELPADLPPRPRRDLPSGDEDKAALRKHLDPGGGTLFADAACGSPSFDAAFRKFVAELLPNNPLVADPPRRRPLSPEDLLRPRRLPVHQGAGGGKDFPQLEGVKINGHWAIIYSKLDIGCALEAPRRARLQGLQLRERLRIASNVVIYATLP